MFKHINHINAIIKLVVNFLLALVIGLLFLISLDHIAIAFVAMMLVLYTAEYAEKKLTF